MGTSGSRKNRQASARQEHACSSNVDEDPRDA